MLTSLFVNLVLSKDLYLLGEKNSITIQFQKGFRKKWLKGIEGGRSGIEFSRQWKVPQFHSKLRNPWRKDQKCISVLPLAILFPETPVEDSPNVCAHTHMRKMAIMRNMRDFLICTQLIIHSPSHIQWSKPFWSPCFKTFMDRISSEPRRFWPCIRSLETFMILS